MQIVKYPPIYSPAFGEVVFQISAAAEELLELDILANDQTTVIGKKRFRGSTLYRVNVAGYGRRQIVYKNTTKMFNAMKCSILHDYS